MTTAEPGRKAPYGKDLRWRMVFQRIAKDFDLLHIASNLVCRTIALFLRTGSVLQKRLCRKNFSFY